MIKNENSQGFTLIETVIVIAIVGFIFGTIIFTTQARIEASRIYVTKSRMQLVSDAIANYVRTFGHLPCPADITNFRNDDNYGYGNGTNVDGANNCIKGVSIGTSSGSRVVRGMVPFKSLFPKIDSQSSVDAWGNRFTYIITEDYSKFDEYQAASELGNGYIICTQLDSCTSGTNNLVANNGPAHAKGDVAFILLSHGPTGHDANRDKNPDTPLFSNLALSALDRENTDGDIIFVQSMPTIGYKDILIYKNRWQLPNYANYGE